MSDADVIRIEALEKKQEKIFDILDEIREKVTRIETKLEDAEGPGKAQHCLLQDNRIEKIEKSIEQLEEKVYRMLGGVAVLCFLSTAALNIYLK